MNIFTGTSGYGYKEWKGAFYPEKMAADKMLAYYASKLESVEINNTFYRMPNADVLDVWTQHVPDDFVFAIKAPQVITHIKRLKNVKEETHYFFKVISVLGKKLGPVLFQFPGNFRINLPLLTEFTELIPPKTLCSFLFRSKTWFTEETFALLRKDNICLALEDTDEKPVEEIVSTTEWGYLRLRKTQYTDTDLATWGKKVSAQKWKKTFVFFKHEDDADARGPQLAMEFSGLIGGS